MYVHDTCTNYTTKYNCRLSKVLSTPADFVFVQKIFLPFFFFFFFFVAFSMLYYIMSDSKECRYFKLEKTTKVMVRRYLDIYEAIARQLKELPRNDAYVFLPYSDLFFRLKFSPAIPQE